MLSQENAADEALLHEGLHGLDHFGGPFATALDFGEAGFGNLPGFER